MKYDPVKNSLGAIFNRTVFLRKLFYRLLDLLLLRSWHIRKELNILRREDFYPGRILDAGTGFGQYIFYLARIFPQAAITGIDINPVQIEDCNRFFKKTKYSERVAFGVEDLTKYRREAFYNLILSVDVMEHIEDDLTVFKNFYKSLKPGGLLLISTPSDRGGSDVNHDEEASFIDEHVRDGYGMDEIRGKLSSAGFSDISVRYAYGKPGQISWLLSMKYPIRMVNISRLFLILLPFYYLVAFPVSFILNLMDIKRDHGTGTGLIVKCIR